VRLGSELGGTCAVRLRIELGRTCAVGLGRKVGENSTVALYGRLTQKNPGDSLGGFECSSRSESLNSQDEPIDDASIRPVCANPLVWYSRLDGPNMFEAIGAGEGLNLLEIAIGEE
jgi:hypothetical protein